MSIENKLTYLDGTKQALKESINNLGGDITSETTFREYAQELDNIYNNIPKTTDTGTNLSLNTIKGKMNIIPKGDTSQNGTPTPDTPIDIEVVTGTQEVVVQNKNLAYIEVEGKYRSSATGSFSINANYNGYIANVRQNTTYTGSFTNMASNYNDVSNLCYFDKNMTFIGGNAYNTANKTFTTPSNCAYVTMAVKTTVTDFQLELGSTATTYTPHQEQTQTISLGDIELCKIGNYQDYLYKSNDKWYKKELIYKIANKTNWNVNNIVSNNRAIAVLASNGYGNAVNTFNTTNAVCNMLIAESQETIISDTAINRIAVNSENIYIKFADTINTAALAKAQLDSMTNLVIYYVVATPNDIEITNTTLIEQLNNLEKAQSYNGITNISSNGNLPIVLGVSALKGE